MVEVTVVARKEVTGVLALEVVNCTATDAYTYKSKFGTIVGAWANSQSRVGSWCSWSGSTVTYHCTSASGDNVCIVIVGY